MARIMSDIDYQRPVQQVLTGGAKKGHLHVRPNRRCHMSTLGLAMQSLRGCNAFQTVQTVAEWTREPLCIFGRIRQTVFVKLK